MNKKIYFSVLVGLILIILASISAFATLNNTAIVGLIAPINNSILTGTVTFNFTLNSTSIRTEKINVSVINYTMVSVYGGSTIILCSNVTGGAATANQTYCTNNTALFEDGLYNVTIHIANQSSALLGTPNSTTVLSGVNISFENYGPRINVTSVGTNLTYLNTVSTSTNSTALTNADFLNRQTEINFSIIDNVAVQNTTFICELHAQKDLGAATTIGGLAALSSLVANKTDVKGANNTNITFKLPSRFLLLNGSITSYQVKCRNSGQSALYNVSTIQRFTATDTVLPANVTSFTFKDSNNIVKTKFELGDTVTISDCSGTDNADEDVQYNVTLKFPGISSFTIQNVSLAFSETNAVGTYEVNCSATDESGNINSSLTTFEIEPKVRDTNAYAVSKAGKPVSKGIVGSGSSESIDVGAEGIGRLVAEGGSLKFTVNNEEHMVIVKEIGKDSVILTVKSTPFDLSLNKGDAKDVDVDGDGAEDVNIKFNGVFFNKADITLTLIEGRTPKKTTTEEKVTPSSKVSEAIKKVTEGKSGIWLVIIVVIIIVVVGYLLVRKR